MSAPDHESAFLDALQSVGLNKHGAGVPAVPQDADTTAETETVSTEPLEHATTEPAPPMSVSSANLWRHPDAHPLALDLLMLRRYGPEWLGWEAETWRVLIPEDFHTPSVSELNIAKLQACKTLHMVDTFWQQWEVFAACLGPFNSEFPDFQVMSAPTVAQCLVACDIAERIREDVEWSGELKAYVATVYQNDGIFLPLPPADFVTLEPPPEIDVVALAERWPAVRLKGRAPEGENPLDEQLRRLLTVHQYLEDSRSRLQRQLHLHA